MQTHIPWGKKINKQTIDLEQLEDTLLIPQPVCLLSYLTARRCTLIASLFYKSVRSIREFTITMNQRSERVMCYEGDLGVECRLKLCNGPQLSTARFTSHSPRCPFFSDDFQEHHFDRRQFSFS